jgi:transcriptional regulator GlxA family with amidase domain
VRSSFCRGSLEDPLDFRTITAISHDCGFLDAAHFSRCFRAAYGRAPSEFRVRAIATMGGLM